MIPDIPLLKNTTLKSLSHGASYDFSTYIFKEGKTEKFQQGKPISFAYHGTLMHENTHWIQHHGTSFGALLSLIIYSQHKTAITWLRALPKSELTEILAQRTDGKPIVNVDRETQELIPPNSVQSKANTLRQIWYDHRLVYNTLLQSSVQDELSWPRDQVINEIISDALLIGSHELGLWKYPGNHLARSYFNFDNQIGFMKFSDKRFTSKLLMETWATASELLTLYNLKQFSKISTVDSQIEDLKNSLFNENSSYGLGLELFFKITELNKSRLPNILPTVSALCYVALNPPVPPLVMDTKINLTWEDFYPPIRYIKLLYAIKNHKLLDRYSKHDETSEFCDHISKIARVPYINQYKTISTHKKNIDFEYFADNLGNSDDILRPYKQGEFDKNSADYFDYILYVQNQFNELRKTNINILINSGENTGGDELINVLEHFNDKKWFTPLLVWRKNNIHSAANSKFFTGWFMQSVMFHESATDLIAGSGEFDYSMLPEKVVNTKKIQNNIDELWLGALDGASIN